MTSQTRYTCHQVGFISPSRLLTKVSTASTTTPAEEDDIMKGIEQTCVTMRNFWDKMCSGFSGLIDNLKQAIEKMANSTNEVVGDVNEVRNKVGS